MIHTEDGWRKPTVTTALEELERKPFGGYRPADPTEAIPRQTFGPRPAAELDAFADGWPRSRPTPRSRSTSGSTPTSP